MSKTFHLLVPFRVKRLESCTMEVLIIFYVFFDSKPIILFFFFFVKCVFYRLPIYALNISKQKGHMDCVHYELARCCIAMSWAKVLQMLISLWIKRRYPEKIGKALSSSCWSTFLGVTLLFPCFIPILCYI